MLRSDQFSLSEGTYLASYLSDQKGFFLKRVMLLGEYLFEFSVVMLCQEGEELLMESLFICIAMDGLVQCDRHKLRVVELLLYDQVELHGMKLQHVA